MKVKVNVRRPYGNVEVEGESLDEVVEGLETFPEWLVVIDKLVEIPEFPLGEKDLLEGIVETTSEGAQITVSRDMISSKDAISLLLYSQNPTPIQPKQIGRLLSISGHTSAGYGSRLSEMKREGTIVKERQGYRLSTAGKRSAEDIIHRLKQEIR